MIKEIEDLTFTTIDVSEIPNKYIHSQYKENVVINEIPNSQKYHNILTDKGYLICYDDLNVVQKIYYIFDNKTSTDVLKDDNDNTKNFTIDCKIYSGNNFINKYRAIVSVESGVTKIKPMKISDEYYLSNIPIDTIKFYENGYMTRYRETDYFYFYKDKDDTDIKLYDIDGNIVNNYNIWVLKTQVTEGPLYLYNIRINDVTDGKYLLEVS